MIVDLAMRLANVCAILVKIGARLTLADRAKIFGDANIGVDEVIGVEDDILPVDLVEAYAHALLHTKIGERHVVALLGHATSGRECGDGAVAPIGRASWRERGCRDV